MSKFKDAINKARSIINNVEEGKKNIILGNDQYQSQKQEENYYTSQSAISDISTLSNSNDLSSISNLSAESNKVDKSDDSNLSTLTAKTTLNTSSDLSDRAALTNKVEIGSKDVEEIIKKERKGRMSSPKTKTIGFSISNNENIILEEKIKKFSEKRISKSEIIRAGLQLLFNLDNKQILEEINKLENTKQF